MNTHKMTLNKQCLAHSKHSINTQKHNYHFLMYIISFNPFNSQIVQMFIGLLVGAPTW